MMKKTIIIFISLLIYFSTTAVAESSISMILLICKNDTISVKTVEIVDADTLLPRNEGHYKLELNDNQKDVLFSTNFNIQFYILTDPPEDVNESLFIIRLPWSENASEINIYNNEKIIGKISLAEYVCNRNNRCEPEKGESTFLCPDDCKLEQIICGNSKCESNETQENCCKDCGCSKDMACIDDKCVAEKCGDGKCDNGENYGNCPDDCPSGLSDGYCDGIKDGLCDPDCPKNEDIDCSKSITRIIIYSIIGVVIAILIFIIFTRSRREA